MLTPEQAMVTHVSEAHKQVATLQEPSSYGHGILPRTFPHMGVASS